MESSRRELLKLASLAAAGMSQPQSLQSQTQKAATMPTMAAVPFERLESVRLGVIGVGGRGNSLIDNFAEIPQVRFTALCDVVPEKLAKAQAKIARLGKQPNPPALYSAGDHAFEQLVARDDIDLVIVSTPWLWHVPMALAAMKHGKHVGVEVPAAKTIADCWDLVNTSEATRRHCIQLENCCYGYNEISDEGEGLWRRFEHFNRNGNLYPTHGFGPVAHYMDIHRGDRFDYLVSMSSPVASLAAYRKEHLKPDDPRQKETYRCGDLNVSLIHTVKGRVINLEHNTSSPQPYDMARELGGHGGTDFVMAYRLIQCIKQGMPPDIDVYDAAAWSAPGPLSEESVAKGSTPAKFPDFTRGGWEKHA
jgi:hypothetical protein